MQDLTHMSRKELERLANGIANSLANLLAIDNLHIANHRDIPKNPQQLDNWLRDSVLAALTQEQRDEKPPRLKHADTLLAALAEQLQEYEGAHQRATFASTEVVLKRGKKVLACLGVAQALGYLLEDVHITADADDISEANGLEVRSF